MRFQLTLRQMLTVPYVALLLLTAAIIGFLSYRAGSNAVDTLSDLVLNETVDRIAQAVEEHVSGSEAVLETVFPSDVPAPSSIADELDHLRERLWLATTIHRDPNNYAYYGDRRGHFIGLWRHSDTEAELRLKTEAAEPRSIYRFSRIRGELGEPVREKRVFDPRERPWFEAAQGSDEQTWTSIYIDYRTLELVATRARRVDDVDGRFTGVVGTDISLRHLNDYLEELTLTENGVAFIVEREGDLLGTSRGPHLNEADGGGARLDARASGDPLITATHAAIVELMREDESPGGARTGAFEGADGEIVQAGFVRLRDEAGLDWIVAVAVPRADFMHEVTRNMRRTTVMAVLACVLIVFVGLMVLRRIADRLRQLAEAASRMGEGHLDVVVPSERDDEIGELARALSNLRERLLTDRLTGIANRESLLRRLEDRLIHHRRRRDHRSFALLFVDLTGFKAINDRFGHDVGDRVLVEVSRRLGQSLRERDTVARFGGDEFAVLLDDIEGREDALRVAENLQHALQRPYECVQAISDEAIRYAGGASIGAALYPEDGRDIETLIRHADTAMYARKERVRERSG